MLFTNLSQNCSKISLCNAAFYKFRFCLAGDDVFSGMLDYHGTVTMLKESFKQSCGIVILFQKTEEIRIVDNNIAATTFLNFIERLNHALYTENIANKEQTFVELSSDFPSTSRLKTYYTLIRAWVLLNS